MDALSRTVLIVDDAPQILRLVEKMLRPRTVKILVAPRPSKALEICTNEPVDLVISDIAMPEMEHADLHQQRDVLVVQAVVDEFAGSPDLDQP